VAVLTSLEDLRQPGREHRSRQHVVDAGRARRIDEIGLHVGDEADGRNRRQRRIAYHHGDGAERISSWIVQIENHERRGVGSHSVERGI